MVGGITTRAILATARLDAALAESDGSVVAPTMGLTYRMRVRTAWMAPIKVNCSTVADSTVADIMAAGCSLACTGQGVVSMVPETAA